MEIEIINISDIRRNRQKKNNEMVQSYLSESDIRLKELFKVINKAELYRVLLELNYSFSQLHKKCLEDTPFRIVVSGRISKLASRQGVLDELFILDKINNFTSSLGVFLSKPKKELVIYKNKIEIKKEKEISSFRSIDAIMVGKLRGYLVCKVILGKGSSQTNSWIEVKSIIKWAVECEFKDNLIFLLDTNNSTEFKKLRLSVLNFSNIHVFSHVDFQLWVKDSL